jgi:predicted nuclease with TOPRIM domain
MSEPIGKIKKNLEVLKRHKVVLDNNAAMSPILNNLTEATTELESESSKLANEKKIIEEKQKKLEESNSMLNANMINLLNEKRTLEEQIENLKKKSPSISIEDMTQSISKALKSTSETLSKDVTSKTEYYVEKFEVELKSGLDVTEGLKIIQPLHGQLTPESLSTVKFTLNSRPKLTIAKE